MADENAAFEEHVEDMRKIRAAESKLRELEYQKSKNFISSTFANQSSFVRLYK